MPRRPHKPTDHTRDIVASLSAAGIDQVEICRLIGVSSKSTLHAHYKPELRDSKNKITALAVSKLLEGIKKGNIRAITFWLQTRAGFKQGQEISGSATIRVEIAPDERGL